MLIIYKHNLSSEYGLFVKKKKMLLLFLSPPPVLYGLLGAYFPPYRPDISEQHRCSDLQSQDQPCRIHRLDSASFLLCSFKIQVSLSQFLPMRTAILWDSHLSGSSITAILISSRVNRYVLHTPMFCSSSTYIFNLSGSCIR